MSKFSYLEDAQSNLRQARWCALIPMFGGGLILAAWMWTEWLAWLAVGFLWIALGCCIFLVGVFLISCYAISGLKSRAIAKSKILATTSSVLILLFTNFPAAGLCILAASNYGNRTSVTIQNDSPMKLTNLRLRYQNGSKELGNLKAGGRLSHSIREIGNRELLLDGNRGEQPVLELLQARTHPSRKDITVTFQVDGTVVVDVDFLVDDY